MTHYWDLILQNKNISVILIIEKTKEGKTYVRRLQKSKQG